MSDSLDGMENSVSNPDQREAPRSSGGLSRSTTEALKQSFDFGFLGPGDIDRHIAHARAFARVVVAAHGSVPPLILDLGSGGGIPGLILADLWPSTRFTLLDAMVRRCAFLDEAVERGAIGDRVDVVCGRAEDLGRETTLREHFDAVVARSFGAPPIAAECAAPFLRVGGHYVASEPPDSERTIERWPTAGLAQLGFGPATAITDDFHFVTIAKVERCNERFPRRVGIPAKRPLF